MSKVPQCKICNANTEDSEFKFTIVFKPNKRRVVCEICFKNLKELSKDSIEATSVENVGDIF